MSINTDQIQKVAALKGADPLLLGDSAGGTALLPITELAKFLAEQDNAVKAALDAKAALSAQETVEVKSVTDRSVEVAAADLPAYIASLPRLRTESLNITVTGGPVPAALELKNFYGPGFIWVWGSGSVEINGPVTVSGCDNYIRIGAFTVKGIGDSAMVDVANSGKVALSNMTLDGTSVSDGFPTGVRCGINSTMTMTSVNISHVAKPISCRQAGMVGVENCSGSENTYGCEVYMGGVILLSGTTPNLMGGSANVKNGGIIASKDGTLL